MMTSEVEKIFVERMGIRAKRNEPLAPYVAYGVGGPADLLLLPENVEELLWIREKVLEKQLPVTVIGSGTNLLVLDGGIRGVVIILGKGFETIEKLTSPNLGKWWVRCGAATQKPHLLKWAIANGLKGLEFSSGVPGTLGGGIYMNAGTKYGCYAEILKELRVFSIEKGLETFTRDKLYFGYREQTAVPRGALVIDMVFELEEGDPAALETEMNRIIQERAEKQPLDYPSCGSTFKNPEGYSAGRLIEKSGLKGTVVGGAEISTKHANFILNKNQAKAQDIVDLMQVIQKKVFEEFKVHLEPEVVVLGTPK